MTNPVFASSLARPSTPADELAVQQPQATALELIAAGPTTAERLADRASAVEPAFYQEPPPLSNVLREGTHIGMTEAGGAFNGFHANFSAWVADRNAQVDHDEYHNDAAHAYNFSREGTLARAGELGVRVHAAADRFLAATSEAERRQAARDLATAYGQYQHLMQDNWAHGGTDRAQHYGARVDENRQSIAAAQRETRLSFAEFGAYLESRGIDPRTVDPGPRPSYNYPPLYEGWRDKSGAPAWDGVDRMWNRDEVTGAIRERFNQGTPLGTGPASL